MTRNDLLTLSLSHTGMPASLASPHIFIVEKNPDIAEMITWTLELAGYYSTRRIRELSALAQITLADSPALILLDVGLLQESASKIFTDVQAQCTFIGITSPPIIVLTTSPVIQKEVEDMGYRAMLKPFHIQNLTQAVHEALRLPLLQRELP